jgi:hypothetical protein
VPNLEKNAKIREKRKQTLLRRRAQEAKTFELKLDKSKISKTKLAILNRLFLKLNGSLITSLQTEYLTSNHMRTTK